MEEQDPRVASADLPSPVRLLHDVRAPYMQQSALGEAGTAMHPNYEGITNDLKTPIPPTRIAPAYAAHSAGRNSLCTSGRHTEVALGPHAEADTHRCERYHSRGRVVRRVIIITIIIIIIIIISGSVRPHR